MKEIDRLRKKDRTTSYLIFLMAVTSYLLLAYWKLEWRWDGGYLFAALYFLYLFSALIVIPTMVIKARVITKIYLRKKFSRTEYVSVFIWLFGLASFLYFVIVQPFAKAPESVRSMVF